MNYSYVLECFRFSFLFLFFITEIPLKLPTRATPLRISNVRRALRYKTVRLFYSPWCVKKSTVFVVQMQYNIDETPKKTNRYRLTDELLLLNVYCLFSKAKLNAILYCIVPTRSHPFAAARPSMRSIIMNGSKKLFVCKKKITTYIYIYTIFFMIRYLVNYSLTTCTYNRGESRKKCRWGGTEGVFEKRKMFINIIF